jgi:DnaJ-class molecular chaperone
MNTIFENWKIDLQYEEWLNNRPLNEGKSDLTLAQAAEILGIAADADKGTAKKAMRNLARKHHPDVGGDKEKMMDINAAFAIFDGKDTPKPEAAGASASASGAESSDESGKSALYSHIMGVFNSAFEPQPAVAESITHEDS